MFQSTPECQMWPIFWCKMVNDAWMKKEIQARGHVQGLRKKSWILVLRGSMPNFSGNGLTHLRIKMQRKLWKRTHFNNQFMYNLYTKSMQLSHFDGILYGLYNWIFLHGFHPKIRLISAASMHVFSLTCTLFWHMHAHMYTVACTYVTRAHTYDPVILSSQFSMPVFSSWKKLFLVWNRAIRSDQKVVFVKITVLALQWCLNVLKKKCEAVFIEKKRPVGFITWCCMAVGQFSYKT